MASVFFETPDALKATTFWNAIGGSVTYDDTTARKSGLASWKCDSGGGNAAASLNPVLDQTRHRATMYFRFAALPASTVPIFYLGTPRVKVTSGGILQLWNADTAQIGSDGSTLSVNTWYRICIARNASASTSVKVFLDGNEDISWAGSALGSSGSGAVGWVYAPGANKILNVQHYYCDDDTSVTDTGDMRVTAKLPDEVNDDNYDTTGGTGAVNERPISETNYRMHAAKSAVLQDWTLQTAAEGDEDISGDTLVARCAWMWSVHSKDGDTYYIVDDGDSTSNSWSDQEVATLNSVITDSASYPSNAAGIGQKSGAEAEDDFLHECGTVIAYIVTEAGETFYQAVDGAVTMAGAIARMTSKYPTGALTLAGVPSTYLQAYRSFGGGITPTGAPTKMTSKYPGGALTMSGEVVTASIYSRLLEGALAFAGAVVTFRQYFRSLSGAVTMAGDVATYRQFFRALSGAISPSGLLARMTQKTGLSGSITPTGVVARARIVFRTFTGGITLGGTVAKMTSKFPSGSITPTGAISTFRQYYRTLTGAITPTGDLSRFSQFFRSLTGGITPTGALGRAKIYFRTLTGSITPTGAVSTFRQYYRSLTGAITPTGAVARYSQFFRSLSGTLTSSGSAAKKMWLELEGAITMAGDLTYVGVFTKALSGAVTMAGGLAKMTQKALSGAVTSAGAAVRFPKKALSGSITPTGALGSAYTGYRALAGAVTMAATLARKFTGAGPEVVRRLLALIGVGQ